MNSQDRFKRVNKIFTDIENDILKDIDDSSFKNSFRCLYYKSKVVDVLTESIVNSKPIIYAAKILYRGLIEHYLVGYYVFLKCRIDSSDDVGIAYYDFYANSEFLKQETYFIQLDNIKAQKTEKIRIDTLKQKYSDLKDLSQSDLEDYHKEARQFTDVKVIGDFLIKNKSVESKLDKIHEILFQLLDEYNILSSWVHGGPFAERETFIEYDGIVVSEEYERIIDWAYSLATYLKIYLVLSLSYERYDKYTIHFKNMYK